MKHRIVYIYYVQQAVFKRKALSSRKKCATSLTKKVHVQKQSQRIALRGTHEGSITVRKATRPARTKRSTLNLAGREPRHEDLEKRKYNEEVKQFQKAKLQYSEYIK